MNSNLVTQTNSSRIILRIVSMLVWLFSLPKAPFRILADRILSLIKDNGTDFTVLYLKETVRIMQAYVSGRQIRHTTELVGIRAGIPTIIPSDLRSFIRNRDSRIIRGVLSLLQLYRIMYSVPKLKLETIVRPFYGLSTTLPSNEVEWAVRQFKLLTGLPPVVILDSKDTFTPYVTAGPSSKVSLVGMGDNARSLAKDLALDGAISFMFAFCKQKHLLKLYNSSKQFTLTEPYFQDPVKSGILGRLSIKLEAAGKVRVFAIVDAWSQMSLKPLHDTLFKAFKKVPQDGTFDQDKPVRDLMSRIGPGRKVFSFDLSAATDRLPIDLQVQILSALIGPEFASHWKTLLVGRDYYIDKTQLTRNGITIPSELEGDKDLVPLRYAVGQPMGALSSWAMLALTHHFIIQISWLRTGGKGWFTDYAVLGDDVIIANEAVAWVYYSIMTSILGVEINLQKSLQSDISVAEFAKRLVTWNDEFTPLGANLLMQATRRPKDLYPLIVDSISKGVTWSSIALRSLYSSKELLEWFDRNRWKYLGPFGIAPFESSLLPFLEVNKSLKYSETRQLLASLYDGVTEFQLGKTTSQIDDIESSLNNLVSETSPWMQEYKTLLSNQKYSLMRMADETVYKGYLLAMSKDPDPFSLGDDWGRLEQMTDLEQLIFLQKAVQKFWSSMSNVHSIPLLGIEAGKTTSSKRLARMEKLYTGIDHFREMQEYAPFG